MKELISIIIPNFNKEAFIHETLTSVVNQSYNNWEALIIDDGSVDKSIAIIEEFVHKDERFKLIKRNTEQKGASSCRNIGISMAQGEYMVFLDSDDILMPHCLHDRMEAFEKTPELDFLVFPMGTFYKSIGDNPMVWRVSSKSVLDLFLAHSLPWTIVSPIWKSASVKEIGGFDPCYDRLQDVEFHTRVLLNSNIKFDLLSTISPDSFYRIGEDRKQILASDFYINWVASALLYIDHFAQCLEEMNKGNKKSLLKGTLIKTLTSILYANKELKISSELLKSLEEDLMRMANEMGWSIGLLKVYSYLYKSGFYKLKGFNFIFQNLYIRF